MSYFRDNILRALAKLAEDDKVWKRLQFADELVGSSPITNPSLG